MNHILLAGIDTLAIGYQVEEFKLSSDEWQALAFAKESAQDRVFSSEGVPVQFKGRDFSLSPKGSRGYEYILRNDDVTVQLAQRAEGGASYPEVRVTFRSQYLWRHGWRGCVSAIQKWLDTWLVVGAEKVSRLDLCVDVNLSLPDIQLRSNEVVSKSRTREEFFIQNHFVGLAETGFTFGKGNLMCRIYDKLAEIAHSQKVWFTDLWQKKGWDGDSSVTRVEFQCRRPFLKSMQVDTLQDLEAQLGDLWAYMTDWIVLKDNNPNDSNRTRWPMKSFWKVIRQAVPSFGVVTGVMRIVQRKPKFEAISSMGRGLLISMAALAASEFSRVPVESAVRGMLATVDEWANEPEFYDRVESRKALYAVMPG